MNAIYKYCPPERIDILENLKIRVTQPICFNDPFETATIAKGSFASLSYQDAKKSFDRFQGSKILTSESDNKMLAQIEIKQWSMNQIKKMASNEFGVISLSGNFNDPLMWGHYADNSRGFLLGLLPLFSIENENKLIVQAPSRVTYQEFPPILDFDPFIESNRFNWAEALKQNYDSLFFTKSVRWQYEQECRVITPLPSEPTSIFDNGYPVHLINLHATQILLIIAGAHASKKLCDRLISYSKNYNAQFCKAFKAINAYSFGLWDEETYFRKIKAFGDKDNFGYNHVTDQDE